MRTMRIYILLLFLFFHGGLLLAQAPLYTTSSASVRFYSSAPVEDIEAISDSGISVINLNNGDISFKIKIRSFKFEKALMQEHFNENYMESEIYPDASFKGSSLNEINLAFSGKQKIVFRGDLTIHGVSKQRDIPVILKLSDGGSMVTITSEFKVKCKDHKIQIPKILWENIAEVISVYINAEYQIISK